MEKQYSVGFSKFCQLMDLWDNYVLAENVEHEIEKFLDHKQLLMFFTFTYTKKGSDKKVIKLYGATEEGRLGFARMKSPNPEDPDVAQDNFTAFDLKSLLNKSHSDEIETIKIFNKKDLKNIKIIDKEKAIQMLSKPKIKKVIKPLAMEPEDKTVLNDEQ